MKNNEPDYLATLQHLLPDSLTAFTQTLLLYMWVRPDGRFLVAAATRLRQLMSEYSDQFPESVKEHIPLDIYDQWLASVNNLQKTPLSSVQISIISILFENPMDEARLMQRSHINRNYLSTFPVYTSVLTTRLDSDPQKPIHDYITAKFIGHAMGHLQDIKWGEYEAYIGHAERSLTNAIPHGSSQFKGSLAIRSLQARGVPAWVFDGLKNMRTAHGLEDIRKELCTDPEFTTLGQHLGYLESFLLERYRGQPEESKKRLHPRTEKSQDTTGTHRKLSDGRPTTYLNIPQSSFIAAVELSTTDMVLPEPSADQIELAQKLDMPLIEIIDYPYFIIGGLSSVDQAPDTISLSLHTRNQVQFQRRQNQFQKWNINYVPIDIRRSVIKHLKSIIGAIDETNLEDETQMSLAAAAALILVSIATGRNPVNLINQFDVVRDSINTNTDNLNVFYDLEQNCLSIRPHRAPTQGIASQGSRDVNPWLKVPDFLCIKGAMCVFFKIRSRLDNSSIKKSITRVESYHLQSFGVTVAQLTEILPRLLLEITGHFSTTVLLTDWAKSSSTVDLHYLTPGARYIYLRYIAALRTLIPEERNAKLEQQIVALAPTSYLGMPNTPDWETLEKTLDSLELVIYDHRLSPEIRHNGFSLAVIMMMTFCLGLRHTIDIQIGRRKVEEGSIAFFREKGDDRLLVIPPRLDAQLNYYDIHMEVVYSWTGFEDKIKKIGSPTFFLFDKSGDPILFHPARFGEYLEEIGITFTHPLNSLRRAVFSELVDLGIRGIVTDHYIGHAADGREPLVKGSAFRIQAIDDLADEIDLLMKRHSWPIFKGPFHG